MNLLLPLLLAAPAFAAPDQPFSTACDYVSCAPALKDLEDGFQRQGELDAFKAPAVYSGECRHMSPDYKQEDVHHGMILLDRKEHSAELGFAAQFGWFYGSNPWKDYDLAKARSETKDLAPVVKSGRWSLSNPGRKYPDAVWQYWLSHDLAKDEVYVVGAWGNARRVYCRLPRNR